MSSAAAVAALAQRGVVAVPAQLAAGAPSAGEVALHRLEIDRVVVRRPAVRARPRPVRPARAASCQASTTAVAAQRAQRVEAVAERVDVVDEEVVVRASAARRARSSGSSSQQARRRAHALRSAPRGTRRSPIFRLSLSTNTGRAGSKRRSASQSRVSNAFCHGCDVPGTRPEHRAAVVGERFEVEHLRALRRAAPAAGGSCREPVGPQITRAVDSRAGSVSSAAMHGAAEVAGSRLRARGRESRSGRARVASAPLRWPPRQQ